jgi:hypothetical protein
VLTNEKYIGNNDGPEQRKPPGKQSQSARLRHQPNVRQRDGRQHEVTGLSRVQIVPEQVLVGRCTRRRATGRQARAGNIGQSEQCRIGNCLIDERIGVDQVQVEPVGLGKSGEGALQHYVEGGGEG